MNKYIYYLSIKSTSLAHYFGKALILPSRFYKNRPLDIQSIEDDYLVLSKNKFLNNSNCSIKLVLKKEEVNSLIEIEDTNLFLYSKPIPISRIKQVYFIDEIQKLKTVDNINRGTAFISTTLSKVIEEESISRDIIVKDMFKYSPELESKIKTYNHILGGLAFVKYTLEGEYSENYFSILSYFNNFIQNKINNRLDKYDGAFTPNGDFWSKLSPLLYETISEKDVLNFSEQEKVAIEKLNGIFKYENIDKKSITYKLAILNIYGEDSSKRKKTDDLISDCKNGKIPKEKQEAIALIFGINNGYSNFRNQYDKKIVKFKMESLLDYYTIESVFQYVINDKKNNEKFEYIDEIFPDEELDIGKKAFDLEEYSTNILKYFTKNILNLSLKELFNNIINQFKNTFIEEMNKKDSELENMKLKIEELNQKVIIKENELLKQQDIVNQLNKNKEILDKDIQKKNEKNNFLNQQLEEKDQNINSLKQEVETKDNELQREKNNFEELNKGKEKVEERYNLLEKEAKEKDERNNTLTKDIVNQNNQIRELSKSIENKNTELINSEQSLIDNKTTFDEEKERIIIEQTLETYLKYDSKKVPELRKIAKEKGIKFTNKSDTIKSILVHKDNRLL